MRLTVEEEEDLVEEVLVVVVLEPVWNEERMVVLKLLHLLDSTIK
jgi:hypothetical protein